MAADAKRQSSRGQVAHYRGQRLGYRELKRLQRIVDRCAGQSRAEMALQACRSFGWRRAGGDWAVVSCRALLLRLERRGLLQLPPTLNKPRRKRPTEDGVSSPVQLALKPPPHQQPPTGQLSVQLVGVRELDTWKQTMQRYHYLGCDRLVGESLRYVAYIGSEPVALLGWAAAALRNGPRDRYIGWNEVTRAHRLPLVVNNVRFLILPWIHIHNLASQILAANLRRLQADWQAAYGHPIVLAETFVDVSRFAGTCYRASNWKHLGYTQGYSRIGAGYERNGSSKAVFVFELHRHARQMLRTSTTQQQDSLNPQIAMARSQPLFNWKKLPIEGRGGLIDVLRQLKDPRDPHGVRHPIVSVMAIAVCATLSGACSVRAIAQWAKEQSKTTLLKLWCRKGKAPSESCIGRVLGAIDVAQLDRSVGEWLSKQTCLAGEGLAIDGKTLRGSRDGNAKPVHLVSAVLHQNGVVIAQHQVETKTNEIKSVEPLLSDSDIQGTVVTGDAMFTQKAIAEHIVQDKHADYLVFVKDNQPTLLQDIEGLHLEAFSPSAQDTRKGTRSS